MEHLGNEVIRLLLLQLLLLTSSLIMVVMMAVEVRPATLPSAVVVLITARTVDQTAASELIGYWHWPCSFTWRIYDFLRSVLKRRHWADLQRAAQTKTDWRVHCEDLIINSKSPQNSLRGREKDGSDRVVSICLCVCVCVLTY